MNLLFAKIYHTITPADSISSFVWMFWNQNSMLFQFFASFYVIGTKINISQVSEEIEGRVTTKLSKAFSRTESRILGALSKLAEFLLNPQVRTCSVAVPGTSRNSNSENRETTGDRSSDDPCPEVRYSSSFWSFKQPRDRRLSSQQQ